MGPKWPAHFGLNVETAGWAVLSRWFFSKRREPRAMTESVWSHNKVEDIYMETFMEGGTGPIPTPYSQLVSTQDHGIPGGRGRKGQKRSRRRGDRDKDRSRWTTRRNQSRESHHETSSWRLRYQGWPWRTIPRKRGARPMQPAATRLTCPRQRRAANRPGARGPDACEGEQRHREHLRPRQARALGRKDYPAGRTKATAAWSKNRSDQQ